jgi:hypothetical protein
MAISRYRKTDKTKNIDEDYKKVFSSRFGPTGLVQYTTTTIKQPTDEELLNVTYATETWALGKRLYKLSFKYYGDSQYWWLIALFNKLGTEADLKVGDTVNIPLPLDIVLNLYGF